MNPSTTVQEINKRREKYDMPHSLQKLTVNIQTEIANISRH
jgi:hypothetical protein